MVSIVGARPQFIKAAMISRAVKSVSAVRHVLIHTGQHYDDNMSRVFFDELEIRQPDYCLGVGSGSHGAQTGRMLEAIEPLVQRVGPDLVLVYGDTNSTLAGALAAAKLHIPVAHVEAGLRSFNRQMPEEINRVLTDHVSDLLFAPTEIAVQNLIREGIPDDSIMLVGDVMYDAALHYACEAEAESTILQKIGVAPKDYLLCTIHRAENTDDPARLQSIFKALAMMTMTVRVVLPLHPRTRSALSRYGLLGKTERRLQLIEPVGYLDMVMLEKHARLIATDSGGVQKEAFFYSVPCVTLRNETEWLELVELGWNHVVQPVSADHIVAALTQMLEQRGRVAHPYGNGNTAAKIVNAIENKYLVAA